MNVGEYLPANVTETLLIVSDASQFRSISLCRVQELMGSHAC